MSLTIIDMRNRPALLHPFFGSTPGTKEADVARWLNVRTGSADPDHFVRSRSVDGYVREIRKSGIHRAVIVGRETPSIQISDDSIASLTSTHDQLIGIASVDAQRLSESALWHRVDKAVRTYGFRGVNIEPGFGDPPLQPDDRVFAPVVEACLHFGVPLFLMSGPTTPDLAFNNPEAVGRLAARYRDLSIVCYHGFYPRVSDILGVAVIRENVFVVPDMYIFAPGARAYVDAANGALRDQVLFGTSYPFRAMKQTVDDYLRLGFRDEVLPAVMGGNAARLLKWNEGVAVGDQTALI